MRRIMPTALVLLVVVVAGCSGSNDASSDLPRPSKAFCRAASRYDKRVSTRTLSAREQVPFVRAIARYAPADVRDDAQTFLDAMQRRANGDLSVVDDPAIKRAVDNLNRRAGQDCGWFRREGL